MTTKNTIPHKKENILTDIFARLWAAWGLLSFVTTFLIIFLPSMVAYLIPGKKGQAYFIAVSRVWMYLWLPLIGCPVRVYGRKYFAQEKNYIVVYNHNALLDVPLSAPFVPGANKTIAKASFTKVPIFGLFYKRGSVLVDRKDEGSRRKSFEDMKKVLAAGMHICLYPEGTRNRTNQPLKTFYDGAFKLAADTNTEIIPCIITGTKRAMPIHKTFFLLPTRLTMNYQPPVSPAGMDTKALKEKIFNLMYQKIIELEPGANVTGEK